MLKPPNSPFSSITKGETSLVTILTVLPLTTGGVGGVEIGLEVTVGVGLDWALTGNRSSGLTVKTIVNVAIAIVNKIINFCQDLTYPEKGRLRSGFGRESGFIRLLVL